MKLKRNIAQILSIGILLNNLSFYSNASISNTEIPNRYETIEGEYITIDDSTEGELVEIEVFGNTVQDKNDLSDIQSVGDLYVDDNGNPILDKQGRKQYKIDIRSNSKNLFNPETIEVNKSLDSNGNISCSNDLFISDFIKVEKDKNYIISGRSANFVEFYDADKKFIINKNSQSFEINNELKDSKYIRFHGFLSDDINSIQVEEGTISTTHRSHEESLITILLPTQLQKVGNVADRLYWDKSKGRYIIEKNIRIYDNIYNNLLLSFNQYIGEDNVVKYIHSNVLPGDIDFNGYYAINNKILSTTSYINNITSGDTEGIAFGHGVMYVSVSKSKLSTPDYEGLNEWWINNRKDLKVMTILKTPEIIETNITSKLKIPTYDGKTHIFVETENGVNSTLKVTVDRLPHIAKNAVEEAEVNSIMDNISLARMYINMLPESTYKDQLHNQLSNVFSSDITLDRKTATANVDVYIKSENMLSLSLNTNSITFEDYSGVEDIEMLSAVNITINSSLPYSLNAYLPNEISNADKSQIMPIDILHIKENSEVDYQTFANNTDKIVLKDNNLKGNNRIHNIDLKLASNNAHKSDIYKTVIKFEAEQK